MKVRIVFTSGATADLDVDTFKVKKNVLGEPVNFAWTEDDDAPGVHALYLDQTEVAAVLRVNPEPAVGS